ncbi:MAG: hypothetical protein N2039_00910 [Gemmataceae bacterium]|nr:hypothetical protein [Gemmataceae bacterium]
MNLQLTRALAATLVVGVASFATLVWAQSDAPLPPPGNSPSARPAPRVGSSPNPQPVPVLTLPAPGESSQPVALPAPGGSGLNPRETGVGPREPMPVVIPPTGPSTPSLPPQTGPAVVIPSPSPSTGVGTSPVIGNNPRMNPPSRHEPVVPPQINPVTIPTTDSGEATPAGEAISAATVESLGSEPNLTGRQEPAVSLEWIGPSQAKVGSPADYTVAVRNICNMPVQQVLVRVRLPQNVQITATEPRATADENVLMWEIGTLLPRQEKNLQLRLIAPNKGDINAQAWVTFTGLSAMRIRVREPKLLIKVAAPEKVLVGDPCTYVVNISNPGDSPAEQVKLHCDLSEGLEHIKGNKIDFDIGSLAAGETRAVQIICGTRAGGEQTCEAYVEGEGGLRATDKAAVNVLMPRIDLEMTGPKLKYLDRKAVYTLKVTNPGDAPCYNVTLSNEIPTGFKFLQADGGGRHDFAARTVSWFLGEVGPGQTREVRFECLAVSLGEHQHRAVVQASRGLKQEQVAVTRVEGLSAIMLELVDLDDPIEVGAETSYEIRITNTGSKTETDVKLVCTVPDKMEFKTATGPVRYTQHGNEIIFDSIPKLAPRADAIFRVTVKTKAPGVANFRSRITSTLLVDGVTKEEATRIYTD